jgi:hypothetical protein
MDVPIAHPVRCRVPESVVWQCSGCGISIDPDEQVVESIERRMIPYGESDREVPIWHYAHVGHEARDTVLGYSRTGQGRLSDLRAKRHGEGSDQPAGS